MFDNQAGIVYDKALVSPELADLIKGEIKGMKNSL